MAKRSRIHALLTAKDKSSPAFRAAKAAVVGLGAAAAAAGFLVSRQLVRSLSEAVEKSSIQQQAETKLAQAIRNTGGAVADQMPLLKARASALQTLTGVGDEVILSNQALLVAMGKLRGEGLERATRAALDLAASGVKTETAFDLIAKAATGYTSTLSRYGIILDESIPKEEKFGAALSKIEEMFGGQAQARMKTFEGRIEALGGRWGDFLEKVGDVIVKSPTLNAAIDEVSDRILDATDNLGDLAAEDLIRTAVTNLGAVAKALVNVGITAINAAQSYRLAVTALAEPIRGAITGQIDLYKETKAILSEIQNLYNQGAVVNERIDEIVASILTRSEKTEVAIEGAADAAGTFAEELEPASETIEVVAGGILGLEDAVRRLAEDGVAVLNAQLQTSGETVQSLSSSIKTGLRGVGVDAALTFGDAMVDAAFGAEVAWGEMFKQLLKDIAKAIIQALILRAVLGAFGVAGFSSGGLVSGGSGVGLAYRSGGMVGGRAGMIIPGGDIGRDSVPVLARPGEAILPRDLTQYLMRQAEGGQEIRIRVETNLPATVAAITDGVRRGNLHLESTALAPARNTR